MALSTGVYAAICAGAMVCAMGPAEAAPSQLLRNHVPRAVSESRRLGPLSPMARLDLAIGLPVRNAGELDLFVEQVADPASPNYRRHLSASEFAERFGPSQEDYDKLMEFVRANGLAVSGTHPNRMILDVTGTVAAVERALHVHMTAWEHEKRGQYFAPDRDPSLDTEVPILDISGLDNFMLPQPMDLKTAPLAATSAAGTGSGPAGLLIGNDFRAAYAPGVTRTGAGQTIGLLEFDGFYASDVTANFKQAGLPAVPVQTVLLDGFNGSPGSANIEVILDIMMGAYMAPGASVVVYEGANPNDILNRMATDNVARQLSSSWQFSPINTTTEQIFKQFIAQGQSYLQASGDDGAYSGWIMPPADDPNVTVVGGTALTTTGPGGQWVSESAWGGSGGGVSTTYAIPSYQQSMNMTALGGSNTMRNIPDVALTAAIQMFLIYNNGKTVSVGGTSAATPLWAGFIAMTNEQAAANGTPSAGFLNPALYALGNGSRYATDLHDITTGSTGYVAIPGFDLATGWGTPAGQPLLDDLSSLPGAPSFTLTAAPGTVPVVAGSSATATIQVNAQNGFSGSVVLSVTGLPSGVTGTFGALSSGGASTLTLSASSAAVSGSYWISIQGVSGSLGAGVGMTLQVTGAGSYTLKTSAAALSIAQGGAGMASITVVPANGFVSTVSLSVSGLPSGVTASFSPAPATTASTVTFAAGATAATGTATVTVTGTSGSLHATVAISLTVTPTVGFSLVASPSTLSLAQGASATSTITVARMNGFNANVALTVTGLPSGVTATFSPATTAVTSTMTFRATSAATLGATNVTVKGTAGTASATAAISLTVTGPPGFTLAAAPPAVSVAQGASASSSIAVTPVNGFTGTVGLTSSGLPTGVTAAFSPATINTNSTMTFTATSAAKAGTTTVTVKGTAGTASATAAISLTVSGAAGFALAAAPSAESVTQGASAASTITLTPVNGFTGTASLTISGLPAGVTATFSPPATATNSTVTFSATSAAATGTSTVTVKGTAGTASGTVAISLTVKAAPGLTLAAAPSAVSVAQGASTTSTITLTPVNGFTGTASLTASGLPTGVTATFSPATTATTSKVTFTAAATAPAGAATVTITATSGSVSAKTTVSLTVAPPPGFKLSSSAANVNVAAGSSANAAISVTPQGGFNGNVALTVTGLPAGVTASFSPASTAATSTLTLTASGAAAAKVSQLTINGVSGNLTATLAITVTVTLSPDFAIALAPASMTVAQGGRGAVGLTFTPVNGFSGSVTFWASGLPSGVIVSFAELTTSGSYLVILTTSSSTPAATSQVSVNVSSLNSSLSHSAILTLTVVAPGAGTALVDMSPNYNLTASAVDSVAFYNGGLDTQGHCYSGTSLSPIQNVGGTQFTFGPMGLYDAVSGVTVTLPAGKFTTLKLLAAAVNGSRPNQTFTVTYTDGTTTSFTQGVSDWGAPQNYAGESKAVTMGYRDNGTGTTSSQAVYLYGYSFALNSAKTVRSVALPQSRNVIVLAMTLTGKTN